MLTRGFFIILVLVVRYALLVMDTEYQFENDAIRYQVMEKFRSICPFTSTCTSNNDTLNAGVPGLDELPDTKIPCCGPCRCDIYCGDQCCPDKPGLNFTFPETELKQQCIFAQYRPYRKSWLNGIGFRMITKCAPNATKSQYMYYMKCIKSSFDFDISDSLEIVPVTSKITGDTYKNRNCAICNHEKSSELIYWEMNFMCSDLHISIPNTHEELANVARNNSKCNIFFLPSNDLSRSINTEVCDGIIDRCNVTGKWYAYDHVTEMACNSYTSIFNRSYKNVHCYICNEENATKLDALCDKLPVTAINGYSIVSVLDFNGLTKKNEDQKKFHNCPAQHAFDNFKKTCRRLLCSDGLSFTDGICAPMFQYLQTYVVYEMTLALHPLQNDTAKHLDADNIKTDLVLMIKQIADHMGFYTFEITSFIKLKTNITAFTDEMFKSNRSFISSDLDYIAFKIRALEMRVLNVSERIEQITQTILEIRSSEFVLFHRNITDTHFQKATSAISNGNFTLILNETSLLVPDTFPEWLKNGISFGYDEGGFGIIPLNTTKNTIAKDTVFALINDPFCPKFILKIDDFRVSFDKDYVHMTDIGGRFSRSDLSFSENGDYTSVCHSLYLSLVEDYYAREQSINHNTYNPMTILTIICTSLSLISLMITLITYCILRTLRTVPGLNNMGLVISLILFMSLTLVNACVDVVEVWLCRVIGVTLHLSLLSSFGWMFICTFHMTKVFTTFSKGLRHAHISKTFTWYVVFAELLSISVIVVTIVVAHVTSDGESTGYTDKPCYVDPTILLYNVAIPVGIAVVANFAMYLYVIISISRTPDIQKSSSQERNNIIIFVKLSSITGMTWIFGFVYQFTNVEVFAYIFTVLNASQGVFIMFSFVVNKRVYDMFRTKRQQSSSMTTSTATASTNMFVTRL